MRRKYFKTRREALIAANSQPAHRDLHVWRMPKGSRRAGQYLVATELEYLNTY